MVSTRRPSAAGVQSTVMTSGTPAGWAYFMALMKISQRIRMIGWTWRISTMQSPPVCIDPHLLLGEDKAATSASVTSCRCGLRLIDAFAGAVRQDAVKLADGVDARGDAVQQHAGLRRC